MITIQEITDGTIKGIYYGIIGKVVPLDEEVPEQELLNTAERRFRYLLNENNKEDNE